MVTLISLTTSIPNYTAISVLARRKVGIRHVVWHAPINICVRGTETLPRQRHRRERKGGTFLDTGKKHKKAECFDAIDRQGKWDTLSAGTAWCGCQRDQETNRGRHRTVLARNCLSGRAEGS